jgi:carbonic anhydrase
MAALAEGQPPRAVIIACCDSRADPAIIFDAEPGSIFVVRNVANLAPPFDPNGARDGVSAAIEYGVTQLDVPEIVVMDHEKCGGISAVLTGRFHDAQAGEGGFIDRWMSQIDESAHAIAQKHGTSPEAHRLLEEAAIRQSMANLRTFRSWRNANKSDRWSCSAATFRSEKGNCGYLKRLEISVPSGRFADARR